MVVTGAPQFETQDDSGFGNGIAPIPRWQVASILSSQDQDLGLDVDPVIGQILIRLRTVFHQPQPLTNMELHDLACFVMHRLLLLPPLSPTDTQRSAISESLRDALALYILTIHGATYYSHVDLSLAITMRLRNHLEILAGTEYPYDSLRLWILSVGLIASAGTSQRQWFITQTCIAVETLNLCTWDEVLTRLEVILWIQSPQTELFRQKWEDILRLMAG